MTHQLSMFTNGEDLPLISGTAPRGSIKPFAPKTEHRQESLAACRTCLDTGTVEGRPCWCKAGQAPEPKAALVKRKPRGKPPYMVHLTWQNGGPKMHQAEETIELAVSTVQHWFKQFAGVKSIIIEDVAENERHVYSHAGYMFTAPAL